MRDVEEIKTQLAEFDLVHDHKSSCAALRDPMGTAERFMKKVQRLNIDQEYRKFRTATGGMISGVNNVLDSIRSGFGNRVEGGIAFVTEELARRRGSGSSKRARTAPEKNGRPAGRLPAGDIRNVFRRRS
jgi:hypothetical protein